MTKTAVIQAVVLIFFVVGSIHADASNKAIVGGNVVNYFFLVMVIRGFMDMVC